MKILLSCCLTLVLILASTAIRAEHLSFICELFPHLHFCKPPPDRDLVVYDDFRGKFIDPGKWDTRFIEGNAFDVVRRVRGHRLELSTRAYADTIFSGGRASARVRLSFPEETVAPNIRAIQAKVDVRAIELIGCADPAATSESRIRARIGGEFFNDGSSTGPGDFTGDIFAHIQLERLSDTDSGDPPGMMHVTANVFRCNDPACDDEPEIFGDRTTLGIINARYGGGKTTIGIVWDPENDRFIFRRDDREVIFTYVPFLDNTLPGFESTPVSGHFYNLEARAQPQNCAIFGPIPTPVTTDLWDISQGASVTAFSDVLLGSDVSNIFGGNFGTVEPGNALFQDNLPAGTVHFVEWRTPVPITLRSFNLIANHDGPSPLFDANQRGFSKFTLFAKNPSGTFEKLSEFSPNNPYSATPCNLDPGEFLVLSLNVPPTTAQEFKAEFVQFGGSSGASGPRIQELDGFETAAPVGPPPTCERTPVLERPVAFLRTFWKRVKVNPEAVAR